MEAAVGAACPTTAVVCGSRTCRAGIRHGSNVVHTVMVYVAYHVFTAPADALNWHFAGAAV